MEQESLVEMFVFISPVLPHWVKVHREVTLDLLSAETDVLKWWEECKDKH